jgi:hypothetical protein
MPRGATQITFPRPLGNGTEQTMPKKAPDLKMQSGRHHLEPCQTIAGMDKPTLEEISISRQERWLLQSQQERQNIIIMHSW